MSEPDDEISARWISGGVPHPDDRLWRHPAEVAAEQVRQSAVQRRRTAELPAVPSETQTDRPGLAAAASVLLAVLAAGTVVGISLVDSGPSRQRDVARSTPELGSAFAGGATEAASLQAPDEARTSLAAAGSITSEKSSFEELKKSFTTVQAATDVGMRDGFGVFITPDGYLATSATLVDGTDYVIVWTDDGRRFRATVKGLDSLSDVAVLGIGGSDWPSVSFTTSKPVENGDPAFLLDPDSGDTVMGEVTKAFTELGGSTSLATPRMMLSEVPHLPGLAVLGADTSLIAITYGHGDFNTGEVAATPAWMVEWAALQILINGYAAHPWLGASFVDESDARVVISVVDQGSPADYHGLSPGDVISSVNGLALKSGEQLWRSIYEQSPGDEIVLTVQRGLRRQIITTRLGERGD